MNNIQFKFNEIMRKNRRSKIELEEDIDNYRREKGVRRRREEQYENVTDVLYTAEETLRVNKRMNSERRPNVNRNVGNFGGESFILIGTMNNFNQNSDSQFQHHPEQNRSINCKDGF